MYWAFLFFGSCFPGFGPWAFPAQAGPFRLCCEAVSEAMSEVNAFPPLLSEAMSEVNAFPPLLSEAMSEVNAFPPLLSEAMSEVNAFPPLLSEAMKQEQKKSGVVLSYFIFRRRRKIKYSLFFA
jgi:hypothetical protein